MIAKPLVLVLVVAGLAIAAWFAWRGGDSVVDQPVPSASQDVPNPPAGSQPDTGQGGVDAGSAAADASAATESVSDRTEAATGGAGANDQRVTVRGRLVDGLGQPLPDAELRRAVWHNPDRLDFGGDFGRNSPQHDFKSDSEGRFRFDLAHDKSASLELPSSDLVFVNSPPLVHGHKGNQDLGDCLVEHSATVSGIVKDELGSPVAGVKVTAGVGVTGFGASSSGTTATDGVFRIGKLRPGVWTLRTASAKYLPTSERLTVEAGTRVDDLVLVVATGSAIAGQVVDDLGRPVPDFRVGAKRTEARGTIEVERFADDEAATTDAGGFFTLAGLAGETATVRAYGPKHSSTLAANVRIGTGNLLLRVDRLAAIEGVLRGVDGGPLAGSRVRAVSERNDEMLSSHGIEGILHDRAPSTRTAADGSFRIEDVRPGAISVHAEGKQHRPVKLAGLQAAPAQTLEGVQLVAERGAVARLSVVDELGEAVAGANVHAARPSADGQNGFRMRERRVEDNEDGVRVFGGTDSLGSAVTDEQGVAVIPGLPAGETVFHAEHADFAAARPLALPLLKNGSVDVALTLRTPGYAELHISTPAGAAAAQAIFQVRGPLGAPDSNARKGRSDAEGKAVVGPLAAGNYIAELARAPTARRFGGASVLLAGDEGGAIAGTEQRFAVAAGKTTIVKLRRPVLTRVFGTVTGVDGPVAGVRVELGKASDGASMPDTGAMVFEGGPAATAGPNGSYSIEDVEPGDYVVRYGKPEQMVKAEARVNVPPELPELQRDLVLRTGKIRVQAWSQVDGAPIANAEVTVARAKKGAPELERRETRVMMVTISSTGGSSGDTTMMTIGGQRAKTGADGWAEIEDVPVGDYDVRVTHDKHVPGERKDVIVNELQTSDIGRVEMTQAGRIRGTIVDADGNQVRMGLVFHRPIDGSEGQPTPAMGGAFTLDALPTGRYVLRGTDLGAEGPGRSSSDVEVDVKAGETATAELRLPAK